MFKLNRLPNYLATQPLCSRALSSYAVNDGLYLGDSLSKQIKPVPLAFDRFDPKTSNSKSPLIFLHGLFGSKTNTRTLAKQLALSMDRTVFCLDLRNFGESPHDSRLDYPALAADVEKFIETQKLPSKPILVGHSMGAKTAMAVALRRPDLPGMLVSVDNAPVTVSAAGPFGKYIRQLRYALEVKKYTNIKDVDAELAKVEPVKEVRQFVLTNVNRGKKDDECVSRIPLDIIGDAVTKGMIALWPFDLLVSRWSGPSLFVRGTESTYVPDDVLPVIGNYFPDFEVRDVKAGHWVISENPVDFKKVLSEWVERKEDDE